MRALLLIVALSVCGYAWSDESSNHKTIAQENESTKKPQSDPKLDTSSLEKTIREAVKEAAEQAESNTKDKLETDRKLVEYTGQLSNFTELLVFATFALAGVSIWQGIQLKRTVDADIRGERPYLFPGDLKDELIPTGVNAMYIASQNIAKPKVSFAIHNIGRTPAILERWCTVLYLSERLTYPAPIVQGTEYEAKTPIREGEWYPPNESAQHPNGLICEYERSITSDEVNEIKNGKLTFFLYGYVIYRDFFGIEHEKRFCFRKIGQGLAVYGGEAYNYEKSKPIPKAPLRLWLRYYWFKLKKLVV